MRQIIKNYLISSIRWAAAVFSSSKVGAQVNEVIIDSVMNRTKSVAHNGVELDFVVPNVLNRYRVDTFSTKEPETLEWIDSIPEGSVLWDIGANVGLYSMYAAEKRKCRVYAFEPSVFNLELLARNLFLNNLHGAVNIIPLALSNKLGQDRMRMTTTEWGGALSSFGSDIGWNGEPIKTIFEFPTFGMTIDQAVSLLELPSLDFIKMDVDGIEHVILEGARETLPRIQQILMEINKDFDEQVSHSSKLLSEAGLCLSANRQSALLAKSKHGYHNTFNQIWIRG
jgi:FkbM family methyltransferase